MIKIFESEVLSVKQENDSVKILKFSVPEDFDFKPGQYVSLTIPFDGKKLRRPYSIASSPGKDFIELCVKIVDGPGSKFINSLVEGGKVEFFGPAGKFVIDEDAKNNDMIFVAVGTGITPFASMIENLLDIGFQKKIILLKGFRYEENILYDEKFSKLAEKHNNFKFYNILSRPKNQEFGNKGYVQNFLEKYLPENFQGNIYICGLSPMINSVKDKLISLGIWRERIFYEKYD